MIIGTVVEKLDTRKKKMERRITRIETTVSANDKNLKPDL